MNSITSYFGAFGKKTVCLAIFIALGALLQ